MSDVTAAPCAIETSAFWIRSWSGGTSEDKAAASCCCTSGSLTSRPATPSVTSAIGTTANNVVNARPLANNPPGARP